MDLKKSIKKKHSSFGKQNKTKIIEKSGSYWTRRRLQEMIGIHARKLFEKTL